MTERQSYMSGFLFRRTFVDVLDVFMIEIMNLILTSLIILMRFTVCMQEKVEVFL